MGTPKWDSQTPKIAIKLGVPPAQPRLSGKLSTYNPISLKGAEDGKRLDFEDSEDEMDPDAEDEELSMEKMRRKRAIKSSSSRVGKKKRPSLRKSQKNSCCSH